MYNESIKKEYFQNYAESGRLKIERLFERISKIEENNDKDIFEFTESEINESIIPLLGKTQISIKQNISIFKKYVDYCIDRNLTVSNAFINIDHLDITLTEIYFRTLVKSPEHLNEILNQIFNPISDDKIDNLFRAIFWFLYSGIKLEELLLISKDDIELKYKRIKIKDSFHLIYKESRESITWLLNNDCFIKPIRDGSYRFVYFPDGDKVLRYFNNLTESNINNRFIKLKNRRDIDTQLTVKKVYISGIFYRVYQDELRGIEPDFKKYAKETISKSEYEYNKNNSRKYTYDDILERRIHEIDKDYKIWKNAFHL